jgi:hypothetical protein
MELPETARLVKAEIALQCSADKNSAQHAIHEYLIAKAETKKATT